MGRQRTGGPLAIARGRPSVTAYTKGSGLSTGKADARAMLLFVVWYLIALFIAAG